MFREKRVGGVRVFVKGGSRSGVLVGEDILGDGIGNHRLVDLKKVLNEALNKHVVLSKIALEVDHLVQDLLVICLHGT